ncbi:hypothetical protein ACG7TL_004572 [Trametes sanguinea]
MNDEEVSAGAKSELHMGTNGRMTGRPNPNEPESAIHPSHKGAGQLAECRERGASLEDRWVLTRPKKADHDAAVIVPRMATWAAIEGT